MDQASEGLEGQGSGGQDLEAAEDLGKALSWAALAQASSQPLGNEEAAAVVQSSVGDLSPEPASESVSQSEISSAEFQSTDFAKKQGGFSPPPAPSTEENRFGPAPRALAQRRLLALILIVLDLVCLSQTLMSSSWSGLRWILVPALIAGLWLIAKAVGSSPLAGREVWLQPRALELRRGAFRRLVVFDSIRHIHITQNAAGRLWSLRLDLEDDSVTLRDVDGLPRLFAAVAQRRPANALIEVEELRVDWGEPLPWMLLALGLSLVVVGYLLIF